MKIKHGFVILAVCLLATVGQAELFVNGGFETGDLTGWDQPYLASEGGNSTSVVMSAFKEGDPNVTITPQAGDWFAETDDNGQRLRAGDFFGDISQDFGEPKQGSLTFWFYRAQPILGTGGADPAMLFHSHNPGAPSQHFNFYWGWNGAGNFHIRGSDFGAQEILSGTEVPIGQWNKIQLTIDRNGIDFSLNNNPIAAYQNLQIGNAGGGAPFMTAVQEVRYQSGWGGMNGALDSFSFVGLQCHGGGGFIPEDIVQDCVINKMDLVALAADWGKCNDPEGCN